MTRRRDYFVGTILAPISPTELRLIVADRGERLPCNGALYPRTDYPELAAVLRGRFGGAEDGSTLRVPDLREGTLVAFGHVPGQNCKHRRARMGNCSCCGARMLAGSEVDRPLAREEAIEDRLRDMREPRPIGFIDFVSAHSADIGTTFVKKTWELPTRDELAADNGMGC